MYSAFLILAMLGSVPGIPWTGSAPDVPVPALAEPIVFRQCTNQCLDGNGEIICDVNIHATFEGASHEGEPHTGICLPDYCVDWHDDCMSLLGAEGMEALRVAILEDRPGEVGRIAASAPEAVFINVARAAVQILDCDGRVFAHLPLPPESLRYFADQ